MTIYQFVFIGAFIALLFPKQSRVAAVVTLAFNAIYFTFIIDLDWTQYYLYSATLNTMLGVILFRWYRVVATLSFLLIPVNIIGYLLCKYYYEPTIYDNMCLIIILLQIITLTLRGLLNGTNRRRDNSPLVFLVNFDSNKNRAKMQKRIQE